MLPLAPRRAAQEVGGARLGHQRGTLPAGAALAAEAQPCRRDQRYADDVAEFRPVAMPADAGADIIFDDEHMAQRFGRKAGETSGAVAARVLGARQIQQARLDRLGVSATTNAHCPTALIEEIAAPDAAGLALLHDASEKLGFSARAYHRVLRVARTLADLDQAETVGRIHLAEAISYRISAERMAQAA